MPAASSSCSAKVKRPSLSMPITRVGCWICERPVAMDIGELSWEGEVRGRETSWVSSLRVMAM